MLSNVIVGQDSVAVSENQWHSDQEDVVWTAAPFFPPAVLTERQQTAITDTAMTAGRFPPHSGRGQRRDYGADGNAWRYAVMYYKAPTLCAYDRPND